MQYVVATTFLACGLFLIVAARQVARDTRRAHSLAGRIPPNEARILGVVALILSALWFFY